MFNLSSLGLFFCFAFPNDVAFKQSWYVRIPFTGLFRKARILWNLLQPTGYDLRSGIHELVHFGEAQDVALFWAVCYLIIFINIDVIIVLLSLYMNWHINRIWWLMLYSKFIKVLYRVVELWKKAKDEGKHLKHMCFFAGRYCWFGKGKWQNWGDYVGRGEHSLIYAGWRIDWVWNSHWWWRFLQVQYEVPNTLDKVINFLNSMALIIVVALIWNIYIWFIFLHSC